VFALADCNAFFVSCERIFRPDLENKAVVVLSNNDGCAISRSNEAKKLDITMGEPFYQFAYLERAGAVTVFSSNYKLYGDMSRRVQQVLRSAVPALEVYSIDESFMDLGGMEGMDFDVWAKHLSAECRRQTGIPVSVGVAPTKTLAKIASKLCKQYPRLRGGCYMYRKADILRVLANFPVDDVWGIGRRYTRRFNAYGIRTALDFYNAEEGWVRGQMGVSGLRTWRELHGEPCIEFEHYAQPKQQICVSRSFSKEIYDIDDLSRHVSRFSAMACEKLRGQHSACHAATIFLLTNRHKDGIEQRYDNTLVSFDVATDSTIEINKAILAALRRLFREGTGYKKAGVVLGEICRRGEVQGALFDSLDRDKHAKLMTAMDAINSRSGHSVVTLATEAHEGTNVNRNHLSPCYTTDWNDIMVVKA